MTDATAQSRQNTIEPILQALEDSKLCVIPTDALLLLLEDNATFQQKANEINEKIANTLHVLKENDVKATGNEKDNTADIVNKLDELISAIKLTSPRQDGRDVTQSSGNGGGGGGGVGQDDDEDSEEERTDNIKNFLGERYNIMEKIVHNEELGKYYTALLSEDVPYAPKKFRTKVYKNTPESELKHRRAQTIDAVNTEIKIMEERALEWRDALKDIDKQIDHFLSHNEDQKAAVMEAIQTDEKEIVDNFEKDYLSKRRNSDRRCKETSNEYMLIFVDDKCHDQSDTISLQGGKTSSQNKSRQ